MNRCCFRECAMTGSADSAFQGPCTSRLLDFMGRADKPPKAFFGTLNPVVFLTWLTRGFRQPAPDLRP